MSAAFLVAAIAGALITGILGTLGCRDRSCFLVNLLAAGAGAFALTVAAKKIGVGYADFGVDLGTGMVFSIVGGLVALLFAAMVRDLAESEPGAASHESGEPGEALSSAVRHASRRRPRSEQQRTCADFQHFLLDDQAGLTTLPRRH